MEIPYTVEERLDTGLNNVKLGIWLFLASEVMLFGGLFSSYVLLRVGAEEWPRGSEILDIPLATLNTIVLIGSSVTMVMAWVSLKMNDLGKFKLYMGSTVGLAGMFLIVKAFEYGEKFSHDLYPSDSTFLAIYFTLTGLHGLHVIGGIIVNSYFRRTGQQDVADGAGALHEPCGSGRSVLALRGSRVDFLFPVLYLL